jgi:hypothetical protein
MLLDIGLPLAFSGEHRAAYITRVVRALDRRRLAAVALVTVLLSLGPLFSSELFDFFSPAEIALAWFEHLIELAVLAVALTAAYMLLDEALPRRTRLRLPILCAMLFGLSIVLTLLLYAYYAHGSRTSALLAVRHTSSAVHHGGERRPRCLCLTDPLPTATMPQFSLFVGLPLTDVPAPPTVFAMAWCDFIDRNCRCHRRVQLERIGERSTRKEKRSWTA